MNWKMKFVGNWGRLGMKSEWEVYTVQELIDKGMLEAPMDGNHGGIHPKVTDYVKSGVPFIMANNLVNGKVDYRNCAFITEKQAGTLKKGFAHPGDVLLTHKATIGRTAIVGNEYKTIILTPQVTYYRVKRGISNLYLKYYFDSNEFQQTLANWAGAGSTRAYLGITAQRKLPVVLPPLEIQTKIAESCRILDNKIELNDKINENLLQQALAIYKAWFCDYVLSDGVLPESWHITTIDALSSLVTRGIAPKYDDSSNQIVLNQKCIRDHTIDVSLARRHLPKKINEKWISKGDLLINSTGTGTLGRVAQVWFDANNMTVDSHVTIVRPKAPIFQSYIGFWGLSHESEIEAQHTGSTGQTELPRDRVKAMELPFPDEDTLSKFNELVIPMTDAVVSNQKENARLSQLRDTLLPKLMSGELDVSELEL